MSPEVTNIGVGAFENCTDITSITIPYGITSINNHTFYGCTGLTDLTIPNNVTSIGDSAFRGCSGLASVTIPDGVTSIGESAFNGCSGLTSITIPDSVTSMGDYCFQNCQGLTSIAIGSGVNNIGSSEFSGCNNCTIFDFRYSTSVPTLENVNAFENTPSNKEIIVSDSLYDTWIAENNWSSDTNNIRPCIVKASQSSIGISDRTTHVRYTSQSGLDDWYGEIYGSIVGRDDRPYYTTQIPNAYHIEEIVQFGSGVTVLGKAAFNGCSLTSVTIPSHITSIAENAFSQCVRMTAFDVENNSNYKAVSGLLLSKDGNTLVTVPAGLTSMTIPASVTNIGNCAFNGCSRLTNVTIPNGITRIGQSAFASCQGLTSMTIPNSVTSIGHNAFAWCYSLTNVTISDSVTSIGGYTFTSCSRLTSVTISNNVTIISNGIFNGCSSLTSLTIPNKVTHIYELAFNGCSSCTIFDFRGATSVPTLVNVSAFNGTSANKKIVVPDSLYSTWISTNNWSSSTNGIVDAIISASDYEQSLA